MGIWLWVRAAAFGAVSLATVSCSVPPHMQIRGGTDPGNEDDDVRFRTTYYFRVFDYCSDPEIGTGTTTQARQILTDSLYRFRMTGKASSLFSQVRFEAGSLTAAQIDPFGATVAFDDRNERFILISQSQLQREAARADKFKHLEELVSGYQELKAQLGSESGSMDADEAALVRKYRDVVEQQIAILGGPQLGTAGASGVSAAQPGLDLCRNLRRGFQVLGPEGWRDFDPNERLILAMSSSGKPLISALNELSGRVLNEQPDPTTAHLQLLQERLRIVKARDRLAELEGQDLETMKASAVVDAVVNVLRETGDD